MPSGKSNRGTPPNPPPIPEVADDLTLHQLKNGFEDERHGNKVTRKEAYIEQAIATEFERTYPRPGPELNQFIERQVTYYGKPEKWVRKILGRAMLRESISRAVERSTRAQEIAEMLGAGMVETISVVREALSAKHRKHLVQGGKAIQDDKGKNILIETPDWDARLRAADQLMRLHGAYAPKQVQLDASINHKFDAGDIDVGQALKELAAEHGLDLREVEADFEVVTDERGGEAAALPKARRASSVASGA